MLLPITTDGLQNQDPFPEALSENSSFSTLKQSPSPCKLPIVTSRPVPSEPEVHFLNSSCRISYSCFQPFKVEINSPWKTISAAQGSAALACIGFAASEATLGQVILASMGTGRGGVWAAFQVSANPSSWAVLCGCEIQTGSVWLPGQIQEILPAFSLGILWSLWSEALSSFLDSMPLFFLRTFPEDGGTQTF